MRFGAKSLRAAIGVGLFLISLGSVPAKAGFIRYSDVDTFNAATNAGLVTNFEDGRLTFPEVSFVAAPGTGALGTGNVFFVPTFIGSALAQSGDEVFDIIFTTPVNAFGFDTLLNGFGPATLQVFNVAGDLLSNFTQLHDENIIGFFGLSGEQAIGSVRFSSINGRSVNTGIDNFRIGGLAQSIPEPLPLGYTGLGLLGLSLVMNRRRSLKA